MDTFIPSAFKKEWVFFLFAGLLLLAVAEAGFRRGQRVHTADDDARRKLIGGIQEAVLGLLALLLAFTFALALSRYDERRLLVVKEANAIGTTWLRASLLPEPHWEPVKELLRRYVDLRVESHIELDDPVVFAKAVQLNAEIQGDLWKHAEAASRASPNDITALFVSAVNEIIDTGAERVASGRAHIPGGVSLLLLIVAAVGCFTSNYAAGALGRRFVLNGVLLPLIITVAMALIFDFAHPRHGLIRMSLEPLIELQASLRR